MNRFFYVLFLSIACCTNSQEIPLHGKRVLIIGDSITQQGQYVSYLSYYLRKQFPNQKLDIVSIGLGSETVSCLTESDHPFPRPCLRERLQRALTKIQPALIIACYGMNDGIYHPLSTERFENFKKGINDLKEAAVQQNSTLVLMSSPPFDAQPIQAKLAPDTATDFSYRLPYAKYDEVLANYSKWLQSQVSEQISVIDLHTAMNRFLLKRRVQEPDFTFSKDGIHPNSLGHLLMAKTILNHFDVIIAPDLDKELINLEKDALFQKVDAKRKAISEGWLPYVGYIRGDTVFSKSIDKTLKKVVSLEEEISTLINN